MPHSMSSGNLDVNDRLLKIMSILYCQGIAADFRKPVEILYPNMAANYLSIIKHPMDLGTLLLECMRGTASIKSIREGLKLVFNNSIRFNAGAPMMEAISRHLEAFASGLFEEIMHVPFFESSLSNEKFMVDLIKKRKNRLTSVSRLPLRDTEVRAIANCVLSVMKDAPPELSSAIERMMKILERYFLQWGALPSDGSVAPVLTMSSIFQDLVESSKKSDDDRNEVYRNKRNDRENRNDSGNRDNRDGRDGRDNNDDDVGDGVSAMGGTYVQPALAGLLTIPLGTFYESDDVIHCDTHLQASSSSSSSHPSSSTAMMVESGGCGEPTDNYNNNMNNSSNSNDDKSNTSSSSATNKSITNEKNVLQKCTLPYLHHLDSSLGELIVTLEERLSRGTSRSSVWQGPYGLVWAQPAKVQRYRCVVVRPVCKCSVLPPDRSSRRDSTGRFSRSHLLIRAGVSMPASSLELCGLCGYLSARTGLPVQCGPNQPDLKVLCGPHGLQ